MEDFFMTTDLKFVEEVVNYYNTNFIISLSFCFKLLNFKVEKIKLSNFLVRKF